MRGTETWINVPRFHLVARFTSLLALTCAVALMWTLTASGQGPAQQMEPTAGTWKTWVISSGQDFRVPPPPSDAETRGELEWLKAFVAQNDAATAEQIRYWDAGAPSYRWIDLINSRPLADQVIPPTVLSRIYAYLGMAMYDATVAAWESKYFYNRKRPGELDTTLRTGVATPLTRLSQI